MKRRVLQAALVLGLSGALGYATTKSSAQKSETHEEGLAQSSAAKSIECSCGGHGEGQSNAHPVQPEPVEGHSGGHAHSHPVQPEPVEGHSGGHTHSAIRTAEELAPELVGKLATCPVTTEQFKVEPTSPAIRYQDAVYVFCCEGCAGEFHADPASFFPSSAP